MTWALYTRRRLDPNLVPTEIPPWEYRGDRVDLEGVYRLSARFDWQEFEFGLRYSKQSGQVIVNPRPETIEVYLQRLPLDLDGSWDDFRLPGQPAAYTD